MGKGRWARPGAALGGPASERRHVGLGPGLVDQDPPQGLDLGLIVPPLRAASGDVGAILLAGDQRRFLDLSFSAWTKPYTERSSTARPRSPSSATRPRRVKPAARQRSTSQVRWSP